MNASRISGDDILRGIKANMRSHHDTLYCNPRQESALVSEIGSNMFITTVDNVRVAGLDVISHERFDYPIVCEKGEIFCLAEDWQDDAR